MKNYLLICLSCFLLSCANTPEDKLKAQKSTEESIEQPQPIYKTKVCNDLTDSEEKKKCSDKQLIEDIQKIVKKHQAKNKNIQSAKLVIEFDIPVNGKARNVSIKRPVDKELDLAVVKFIMNTQWSPAIFEGKKVEITRRLPIYIE